MPPQQIDHGIGNENADVGDRHPHKMVLTAYIHAVPCGSGVIEQDQQHYDPDGIDFYVRRHFQIHCSSPKRWGLPSLISRFRPPIDIVGVTTDPRTWRKLALSWGVTPVLCEALPSTEVLFYTAKKLAKAALDLQPGDRIVITGGVTNGTSGNTNLIKVEQYD